MEGPLLLTWVVPLSLMGPLEPEGIPEVTYDHAHCAELRSARARMIIQAALRNSKHLLSHAHTDHERTPLLAFAQSHFSLLDQVQG